jgi:cephalosporin hydroxylase
VDANPLEAYVYSHETGPGIWKWRHYFPIYHRHFQRFVGQDPTVVEIGVFSGGSLAMWRHYFGPQSRIYGVDRDPACRAFEAEGIQVFTGDQGDLAFWDRFLERVPEIDVVIDDGSHQPQDQITTLEALLPHVTSGGVYICEDALGPSNPFHGYVADLTRNLHEAQVGPAPRTREPTGFQHEIDSVHIYPWVVVIEKRSSPLELYSIRQGSEWLHLQRR